MTDAAVPPIDQLVRLIDIKQNGESSERLVWPQRIFFRDRWMLEVWDIENGQTLELDARKWVGRQLIQREKVPPA